jgi:nitrate/nitrite transport system substrate-binding protein
MAVWILTQMRRWGYLKQDVDYKQIAEQVYLAADCGKLMKELGYSPPAETYREHVIMGKPFEASRAREYVESFPIKKT